MDNFLRQFTRLITGLVAFFALLGCATLGGRQQIVSIDSSPRGATVYSLEEEKVIGATPMFYRIPRYYKNDFKLTFKNLDNTSNQEQSLTQQVGFECRYRWILSGLGNLYFAGISPLAYLGALSIDLISGAAFDCERGILATQQPQNSEPSSPTYCKRFLVAPPEHFDEEFSDKMAHLWLTHATKILQGCETFLDYEVGKSVLEYINVTHHSPEQLKKAGHEKLSEIAMKHNVTHFIVLKHEIKGNDLEVSPSIVDLHSLKPDSGTSFKPYIISNAAYRKSTTEAAIRYTVSLFPNSVTFGETTDDQRVSSSAGWHILDQKRSSMLPKYISRFGLTSIAHSAGYSNWEFESNFFPSFAFVSESFELKIKEQATEHVSTKQLFYLNANPLYNYELSFHTPLGAYSVQLGAGVSVFAATLTDHSEVGTLGLAMAMGYNWRFFLTENIFFQTGRFRIETSNPTYIVGPVKINSTRQANYIQLGYFLPEMRRKFRSVTGLYY